VIICVYMCSLFVFISVSSVPAIFCELLHILIVTARERERKCVREKN